MVPNKKLTVNLRNDSFFPLFCGTGFAKLTLYSLSYTSKPFCFGYFWRWGFLNYLPGLASKLDPPDHNLPGS
jgi:hypothetical protein